VLKKRLVLIIVTILALGVLGGGFYAYRASLLASAKPSEPEKAPHPPKVTMGPVYPLEPFLVNLAEPGRPRFLKVVLNLELDSPAVSAELDGLKPKVRDNVLTLLSSKSVADLTSVGDKERLRNEIIHRINSFLSAGKVIEVYFVEFVVQ
jgi:flagellar FliL protein